MFGLSSITRRGASRDIEVETNVNYVDVGKQRKEEVWLLYGD